MSQELERSRRRLAESVSRLRREAEREIGWVPPAGRWTTILVAVATGFAVGAMLAARRRGLPSGRAGRREPAEPREPL